MKNQWLKLEDIESSRTYILSGNERLKFEGVEKIYISDSGTHYLILSSGLRCIVHPKWLAIELDVPEFTYPKET